jgi:hypothetical protein
VIVAFVVQAQLVSYFTRKPPKEALHREQEFALQQAVYGFESIKRLKGTLPGPAGALGGSPDPEASSAMRDRIAEQLREARDEISPKKARDTRAALLYAAMSHELGEKLSDEGLAALAKGEERFRAAAEAYREPSLTPARARELAGRMKGEGFAWKMARVHALEKSGDRRARIRAVPTGKLALLQLLFVGGIGAVFLGGVLLLVFAARKKAGRWQPAGFPPGVLDAVRAERFAARTAQLLLLWLFAGLFVGLATRGMSDALQAGVSGIVVVAVALLLYRAREGWPTLGEIGIRRRRLLFHALVGLAGALANLPLMVLSVFLAQALQRWLPAADHPATSALARDPSVPAFLSVLAAAAILAPLFEEICFRGTLVPALASATKSPLWGIVVGGLVFAAIHPTGIPAWPALAVVGITAATLTYETGSLIPAIVMHALHNAGLLLLQYAYL